MIIRPQNPDQLIRKLKSKPLILYGMGGFGARIANWCDKNNIDYIFTDQNAINMQGNKVKTVILPEVLRDEYAEAHIVVSSLVYYDEIVKKLLDMKIDRKRILSFKLFASENIMWKDLENVIVWGEHTERLKTISEWIPTGTRSVVDYGEGKQKLKKFIDSNIKYYPIDYVKRSIDTIICDFNDGDFPLIKADVSVCTATLIFITTADALLRHMCKNTYHTIILSYVTFDIFSNIDGRRTSGYVNDLTQNDIIEILVSYDFILVDKQPDPANKIDTLYLFSKN